MIYTTTALTIIIIALLYYIYAKDKQHNELVNDLMDRIMSKDFAEYKDQTTEPKTYDPVVVTEEDEYYRELAESRNK